MSELRQCPFCGVVPRPVTELNRDEGTWWAWVTCKGCHNVSTECEANGEAYAIEGAVRNWNTRPIEDALRAELEILREAAKGYLDGHHYNCVGKTDGAKDDCDCGYRALYGALEGRP